MAEKPRLLDFPIPLSEGIAWLRLPFPMSERDIDSLLPRLLWNLEQSKYVLVADTGAEE